ncbi:hypothetical protein HMPREF0208_01297 [Citrobacter koseri]|nr:hypothetical protein HMPREF3220_01805 [Citrobacter koseri]KXA06506.1 hypothetical protein HMPREF3207_00265 [Citrobacter koseri]KXB45553.1 hypothetical protein HMPREF0208_01297 [Citrobacter koseri]
MPLAGWTCRKRRLTNKKTFSNGGNPWWVIRDSRELDIARHLRRVICA